jgi:hypothetical protein
MVGGLSREQYDSNEELLLIVWGLGGVKKSQPKPDMSIGASKQSIVIKDNDDYPKIPVAVVDFNPQR